MKDSPLLRTALAVFGGVCAAILMLGVLAVVNGGLSFADCTGTARTGWIVPLIGGIVIGLTSLALLQSGEEVDRTNENASMHASTCLACGNPILDEWRLCPHCGELLECSTDKPKPQPSRA